MECMGMVPPPSDKERLNALERNVAVLMSWVEKQMEKEEDQHTAWIRRGSDTWVVICDGVERERFASRGRADDFFAGLLAGLSIAGHKTRLMNSD